jgi:nucleotide-binding universal stress UspA family protein
MNNLVVGVDGSVDSLAALDWAAHLAGPDGVVHVVHAASPATALLVTAAQMDPESLRLQLARDVEQWAATARAKGATVDTVVVEDDPVDALTRIADQHDSDAIVVGPHGHSSVLPRALGSMTAKLLHHSQRPIVIVRHGAAHPLLAGGTVVVGVGHGAATRAALRWASVFADRHSMALSLTHAVGHRPVFSDDGLLDALAWRIEPAKLREWAEEDLAEVAEELRSRTDDRLPISWTTSSGKPGPRLVEAASEATLLVVGKHAGGVLGSHFTVPSLHHVVTHAPCPVVVVSAGDEPS